MVVGVGRQLRREGVSVARPRLREGRQGLALTSSALWRALVQSGTQLLLRSAWGSDLSPRCELIRIFHTDSCLCSIEESPCPAKCVMNSSTERVSVIEIAGPMCVLFIPFRGRW